jgi:hypothetical protein
MNFMRKRPATLGLTVATAGTRVPLSASNLLSLDLVVQALPTNTSNVFVGGADVTSSNGIVLTPGGFISVGSLMTKARAFTEFNLAEWFVDAATNGQGVRVLYYLNDSVNF